MHPVWTQGTRGGGARGGGGELVESKHCDELAVIVAGSTTFTPPVIAAPHV